NNMPDCRTRSDTEARKPLSRPLVIEGRSRWRTRDRDPSGTPSPWVSQGLRPPFHRTRTVAWAARRARLRKDGIGWTQSLLESTSPRTSWTWRFALRANGSSYRGTRRARGKLRERLRKLQVAIM